MIVDITTSDNINEIESYLNSGKYIPSSTRALLTERLQELRDINSFHVVNNYRSNKKHAKPKNVDVDSGTQFPSLSNTIVSDTSMTYNPDTNDNIIIDSHYISIDYPTLQDIKNNAAILRLQMQYWTIIKYSEFMTLLSEANSPHHGYFRYIQDYIDKYKPLVISTIVVIDKLHWQQSKPYDPEYMSSLVETHIRYRNLLSTINENNYKSHIDEIVKRILETHNPDIPCKYCCAVTKSNVTLDGIIGWIYIGTDHKLTLSHPTGIFDPINRDMSVRDLGQMLNNKISCPELVNFSIYRDRCVSNYCFDISEVIMTDLQSRSTIKLHNKPETITYVSTVIGNTRYTRETDHIRPIVRRDVFKQNIGRYFGKSIDMSDDDPQTANITSNYAVIDYVFDVLSTYDSHHDNLIHPAMKDGFVRLMKKMSIL